MTRWIQETGGTTGAAYDARFRALAASGADVHGEATYLDALVGAASNILDAGCGTGRVAVELHRRGHRVVGVDSDPSMLAVAREHPGPSWVQADLAGLDLTARFEAVVAAGNVLVFVAPGSEPVVLTRMAAHLRPGGLLVCGWRTDRLAVPCYDDWAAAAGLTPVTRHATWQGDPYTPQADWCVAVDQRPPAGVC